MRSEFPRKIQETLARRAGFMCSIPDCRRLTIGPGERPDEVSSSGVAAHILAASPGGPRGQASMPAERLSNLSNAIWLCARHARLVDNNEGRRYSAQRLASFRDLHEAWVARAHGEIVAPFGWVSDITITQSPLFVPHSYLSFGQLSVICGGNESGKTALCEFIAGSADASLLRRWMPLRESSQVDYAISYYSDERHEVRVTIDSNGIRYQIDGEISPFNPIPFRTVLVTWPGQRQSGETPLGYLARFINESLPVTKNLLEIVPKILPDYAATVLAELQTGEIALRLVSKPHNEIYEWATSTYVMLATGMAIAKADVLSNHHPTLLVLDGLMTFLDDDNWRRMVEAFSSDRRFQTVVARVSRAEQGPQAGRGPIVLEGRKRGIAIRQT